jgi:hypothetical protein
MTPLLLVMDELDTANVESSELFDIVNPCWPGPTLFALKPPGGPRLAV